MFGRRRKALNRAPLAQPQGRSLPDPTTEDVEMLAPLVGKRYWVVLTFLKPLPDGSGLFSVDGAPGRFLSIKEVDLNGE